MQHETSAQQEEIHLCSPSCQGRVGRKGGGAKEERDARDEAARCGRTGGGRAGEREREKEKRERERGRGEGGREEGEGAKAPQSFEEECPKLINPDGRREKEGKEESAKYKPQIIT